MKKQQLRVDLWAIISRAVEEGIAFGLRHYNKQHDDETPVNVDTVAEYIEREIMNALSDVLKFD